MNTTTITLDLAALSPESLKALAETFIEVTLYDELDHVIGQLVRLLDVAVDGDDEEQAHTVLEVLKDLDTDLDTLDLYRDAPTHA